jgi:hypothetical protein
MTTAFTTNADKAMENTKGSDEAPLPCSQKEAVGDSNLHYINDTPFDDEVRKIVRMKEEGGKVGKAGDTN